MISFGQVLKRPPEPETEKELFDMINRYGGMIGRDVRNFISGPTTTYLTADGTMWDLHSVFGRLSHYPGKGYTFS